VLPAALCVCQRERFDGAAFHHALAVGFEVSARLARTPWASRRCAASTTRGRRDRFFSALAAAVGKLYGLDEEGLASAMGIAARRAPASSSFAWSGGDTNGLHLDAPASSGWRASCSRAGRARPATISEGRYGYFNAFPTPPRMEQAPGKTGDGLAIERHR